MKTERKKTDRRTLYTKKVIKDSFLLLKRSKAYADITVADLCREAEISRGTFYLHYRNTADVLHEVLEEAVSAISSLEHQLYPQQCANAQCGYPLCRYIRENETYHCLFFDDTLSALIVGKIYSAHKESIIRVWAERTRLSVEQLEMIAWFQLNGCFAAAKKSKHVSDESWAETQNMIDTFLRKGFATLDDKN